MAAIPLERFTPEELGLPPRVARGRRTAGWLLVLAATLLAAYGAGVFLGRAAYRHAEGEFVRAAVALSGVDDPEALRAAVRALQDARPPLAESVAARLLLAEALMGASAKLPESSWPAFQEARQELEGAKDLLDRRGWRLPADAAAAGGDAPPDIDGNDRNAAVPDAGGRGPSPAAARLVWAVERQYAYVLMELGEDAAALAAMDRADAWLPRWDRRGFTVHKRGAVNDRAYLLAVARDPRVRNPPAALRLAELMLWTPATGDDGAPAPHASDSAALVDTLASAYRANGRRPEARTAQRMALGLADGDELAVYLRHYRDLDAPAAAEGKPPSSP